MNKKNIKPIFDWAKKHGDANIDARILVKIMPQLVKEKSILTSEDLENSDMVEVSNELYKITLEKAQELVGMKYV